MFGLVLFVYVPFAIKPFTLKLIRPIFAIFNF
jgi:hypothetical protein